jgi:hypothetical protein
MKTPIYPKWEDIINETHMMSHVLQYNVSRSDLIDIIETAREIGIDEAIQDFIEANYEPIDFDTDVDYHYDQIKDKRLMDGVA